MQLAKHSPHLQENSHYAVRHSSQKLRTAVNELDVASPARKPSKLAPKMTPSRSFDFSIFILPKISTEQARHRPQTSVPRTWSTGGTFARTLPSFHPNWFHFFALFRPLLKFWHCTLALFRLTTLPASQVIGTVCAAACDVTRVGHRSFFVWRACNTIPVGFREERYLFW